VPLSQLRIASPCPVLQSLLLLLLLLLCYCRRRRRRRRRRCCCRIHDPSQSLAGTLK
jgi:hypothetical protein